MKRTQDTAAWSWLRTRLSVLRKVGYRIRARLRPMAGGRHTFEVTLYAPPGGAIRFVYACYPDWYDVDLARIAFEDQFGRIRA